MRASSCASATALAVALCGCSGVKVRNGTGDGASDVHGIPFYVKVPWRIQETSLASREIFVVFTVTKISTDEAGKPTELVSTKVPMGETLRLSDTSEGRDAIKTFVNEINGAEGYEKLVTSVRNEVATLSERFGSKPPEPGPACKSDKYELVSNSWSAKMLPGTTFYYIEPQNPFIGSASADIHLADDGTLSESSTSVTNQTASTVLSALPVTAEFSKLLNLPPAAAPAAAPAESGAAFAQAEVIPGLKKPVPRKKQPVLTARVDVSETPAQTVYQLRRATRLSGDVKLGGPRLNLCQALAGDNETELVSIKTQSDSSDDKGGGKNAWQISGQLVPPKADKPDKGDKAGAGAKN